MLRLRVRRLHTVGLCGLPNVGKSTLWNALTSTQAAQVGNYPFCTIEPSKAKVGVPDPRLKQLAAIANSQRAVPTLIEVVDVAGLIKGASQGKGLGNQFLQDLRSADVLCHVVRCFRDPSVVHVGSDGDSALSPEQDVRVIRDELILADLEKAERLRGRRNMDTPEGMAADIACRLLDEEHEVSVANVRNQVKAEEFPAVWEAIRGMQLLTSKHFVYIANVESENCLEGNELSQQLKEFLSSKGESSFVCLSANLEEMASTCDTEEEQREFLKEYGLQERALDKVIRVCSQLLEMQVFYTVGEKEARAWEFKKGSKAVDAAGVIHSDFSVGFVAADVIEFDDFVKYGGESGCRRAGRQSQKGRDYIVQDGDIVHFRFNNPKTSGAAKKK